MDDVKEEETFPTPRELELLSKLREKEKQVNTLVADITALRAFLPTQPFPAPSASSQSLPPSLLALLTPLLRANPPSGNASSSVLTSRLELLQRENDELYEVLRESNVGMLREQVTALQKTVGQLENALKESNGAVESLSSDLSQAQNALAELAQNPVSVTPTSSSGHVLPPTMNGTSTSYIPPASASLPPKPIPTGPRLQASIPRSQPLKRPRDSRATPPRATPISSHSASMPLPVIGISVRGAARSPELQTLPRLGAKRNSRSRSPVRRTSADREWERDRDRGRDRDRDTGKRVKVERSPPPGRREEGIGGGAGASNGGRRRHGRRSGGPPRNSTNGGGAGGGAATESRSLVERMGL